MIVSTFQALTRNAGLLKSGLLAAGLVVAALPAAAQDGDAAAGQKVFNQCRACHSLDEGRNLLGPSLHDVVGRKAGTLEGFRNYSTAMKKSDLVWTEENLAQYLANPRAFLPGNRMIFVGLKRPEDIRNVIAYIKRESTK